VAVGQSSAGPRRVVIDPEGKLPGRGAYLCRDGSDGPRRGCLERALKRGSIGRALHCAVILEPGELVESVL
jgi:predicted RNA-binding protein YlxR (DUF448 family)